MAYKEVCFVDLKEIIRRWRDGHSQREIARKTGYARDTVGRYLVAVREMGLERDGPEPTEGQLAIPARRNLPEPREGPTPAADLLAAYRERISTC